MSPSRTILLLAAAIVFSLPLPAQTSIGELAASDASVKGAVRVTTGNPRVGSGSTVTAGEGTALLRLVRGGEVRICPRSSVSITASQNGRELMLAMDAGAIETHYTLASSADTVLTPDFRILLAGPGDFHFAIATDTHGNTCVRALHSDTASLIVTELMGEGIYQVRSGEQVLFRNGSVKDPANLVPPDCGCPSEPRKLRAEDKDSPSSSPATAGSGATASRTPVSAPSSSNSSLPALPSMTAPPPPVPPGEVHVSVDAPFVFDATQPTIPPPPAVAHLHLQALPPLLFELPPVSPPAPPVNAANSGPGRAQETARAKAPARKGLFGRIRSFLGAVFRS